MVLGKGSVRCEDGREARREKRRVVKEVSVVSSLCIYIGHLRQHRNNKDPIHSLPIIAYF